MPHSGLALNARSAAGAAGAGSGVVTCTPVAAGSVQFDTAGDPARAPSAGASAIQRDSVRSQEMQAASKEEDVFAAVRAKSLLGSA